MINQIALDTTTDLWKFDETGPSTTSQLQADGETTTFDLADYSLLRFAGASGNCIFGGAEFGNDLFLGPYFVPSTLPAQVVQFSINTQADPRELTYVMMGVSAGLSGDVQIILERRTDGGQVMRFRRSDTDAVIFTWADHEDNVWYDVALQVVYGGQMRLLIDAVEVASIPTPAGTPILGACTWNTASASSIDEFRRDVVTEEDLLKRPWAYGDTNPTGELLGIGDDQRTLHLDLPLLNDEQFSTIRQRGLTNRWPTYAYDDGNYPLRTIYVWPIPLDRNAVELWLWEPLVTYQTLDEELNLPPGYERYLKTKLALELCAPFGKSENATLVEHYMEAKAKVQAQNMRIPKQKLSMSNKPAWNYITFVSGADVLPNWKNP